MRAQQKYFIALGAAFLVGGGLAVWKLSLYQKLSEWYQNIKFKKELAAINVQFHGYILTPESFQCVATLPLKFIDISKFWKMDHKRAERLQLLKSKSYSKYIALSLAKLQKEEEITANTMDKILHELKISSQVFEMSWKVYVKSHSEFLHSIYSSKYLESIPTYNKFNKSEIEAISEFINEDKETRECIDNIINIYQEAHADANSKSKFNLKKQIIDDILMSKYRIHFMQFCKLAMKNGIEKKVCNNIIK
jgi:hypothetical protein